MAKKTRTAKLGVNTAFFAAEIGSKTERDVVDLDKLEAASRGYVITIQEVGAIHKDERFKEFVSVSQQALGIVSEEAKNDILRVLKWNKENKIGPKSGGLISRRF